MKKSVRILAAILLFSTLLCSLPIEAFAEQLSFGQTDNSSDNSENTYDEHGHDSPSEPADSSSAIKDTTDADLPDSPDKEAVKGTGIPGDVNGDGAVNNIDAILLYRFVLGDDAPIDADAPDINGDGAVDHEDVVALFRYISGWVGVSVGYGYGWALGCMHDAEYVPPLSASCTSDGNTEYWLCKSCELKFSDEECKNIISDADIVISAYSKHTFGEWNVISEASCTESGLKQHICTSCGFDETVETDALEHTVEEYYTEREASCTEGGLEVGFCTVCEGQAQREISPTGHEAGDPINTDGEMCLDRAVGAISCTECGEVLSTYGHYYVTTVTDATCTSDGEVRRECSRCHIAETTVIAHEGHREGFITAVKAASCTESGIMAIACLYCDYIFEDTEYETPALGHEYTAAESDGYYIFSCVSCDRTYTEEKEDVSVYKITLVSEYGENAAAVYVKEGTKVSLPLLSHEGYAFLGWFTDEALELPFDEEYIESDLTLYASWEYQGEVSEENAVLSGMPEDFSFTVKTDKLTDPKMLGDTVIVIDAENNAVSIEAENMGGGVYKITPGEPYKKGGLYKIILRGDACFTDYEGKELWFTVKKDNGNKVTVRPGVVQISRADIFAITNGENDTWYFMLYEDILNVSDYFVVYDGDIDNITHSGRVYEEGSFDKYHVYRIDELKEDEISQVFADIDIYYEGEAELGELIPDEDLEENAMQQFLVSPLYNQILAASETFAHLSGDGKYYYDYHYPDVKFDYKREGNKVIITFTVNVTFGRLDTDTREVKDLYTITFLVKNETTFNMITDVHSIDRFEIILAPVNKTTVGIYAKAGGKIVNDKRLEYFKEVFIKAKDSGKTDELDDINAQYNKHTTIVSIPLAVIPGVSVNVELYNVFTFEAMGEIGLEVVSKIEPRIGVANYGGGIRIVKGFKYSMSVNAYAHAKVKVLDQLGAKLQFSLIGMIHVAAGIEVGPYAEAGGLLNVVVEWGTKKPLNFGASAGGYVEAGVDVDAYIELRLTTLVFKIQISKTRWTIYDERFVLFSVGNKEMPIKFETSEETVEKKIDLLYTINLFDYISRKVVYQNLQTMKSEPRNASVTIEILNKPEYAVLSQNGSLMLNEKAGDLTHVDLRVKVSHKTLFKIVNISIDIEHDYADEFTCHDRTCLYCGYLCKATTPHVYSDWVAVDEGVCSAQPYSMRICFDCRVCEFNGIDGNQAQHHDYQITEHVPATCTEDGYVVYRCMREGCDSESQLTEDKSPKKHDLIWIDDGDMHYQHCKRVGCGYDSERKEHITAKAADCTNASVCRDCGHVMSEALGHSYATVEARAATCTEPGYYNYMLCCGCGDKQGYTEIDALGHDYSVEWKWNGFASALATATCANGHSEKYTITSLRSSYIAPGCLTPGQKVYTVSINVYGKFYRDSKTETLSPLGHNIINVTKKASSCTEAGWNDHEFCTRCSHTTKQALPMLSHKGGFATCTSRAVCDICGDEYGDMLPHAYGREYVGVKSGHYHVCGCASPDKISAHTPDRSSPTETEAVVCTVCDYVISPATGHIEHKHVILFKDGTHHWYKCNGCSDTTDKVAHFGAESTSCKRKSVCEECNTVYGEYGPHNDITVPGGEMHWSFCFTCFKVTNKEYHHGGNATCTTRAKCEDCGIFYGEKGEHSFAPNWNSDAEGHYHECVCGEIADRTAHTPDRDAPTETEPVKCSACGYIITQATGHINHVYSVLKHDGEKHWYKCTGCDQEIGEAYHNGGAPTCTDRAVCTVCNTEYGDEPDHEYVTDHNDTHHWQECTRCDFKGREIAHEGGYRTCVTQAVCDMCGNEYGGLGGHRYEYLSNDYSHQKHCTVCKETEAAAPHTGGSATCKDKAVCTECGNEYGSLAAHTPDEDDGDCTTAVLCTVCGGVTTAAKEHTGGEATCESLAVCTVCGMEYGGLAGHIPERDDGDCTTAVLCTVCGEITTSAKSHTGGEATCTSQAVCTECGKAYGTLKVHTPEEDDGDCTTAIRCTVCGEITTPAMEDHTPANDDGDCTTEAVCTVCGMVTVPARFHTGGEATCTEKAVCTECGKAYGTLKVHTPEEDDGDCTTALRCTVCGEITTPAKAEHIGGTATCKDRAVCTECGNEYGELARHTPEMDDGDCTTAIVCVVCGKVTTAAKGHSFTNSCDTSCNNSGCKYTRTIYHIPGADDGDCTTAIRCTVCGEITTPAKNHTGGEATCTNRAVCTECGKEYGTLKAHTPDTDDGDCTTEIRCTVCGNITTDAKAHRFTGGAEYDYDNNGHWRICANAGCRVTNKASATEPHSFGEWYIPTHDSSIHARDCVCGKIDWASHTPAQDDGNCKTEVLCTVCDLTAISALEHDFSGDYVNNTSQHWHICANEGCSITDTAKAHIYGEYTVDESDPTLHKHTCTHCKYSESFAHDFEGGAYVTGSLEHWKKCKYCEAQDTANKEVHSGSVATCTQKSVCYTCNAEYGELDPNNHDYKFTYDDLAHYDKCTRCGKITNSYRHTLDYRVDVKQVEGTYEYAHSFTEFCNGCDYTEVLSTDYVHMHEGAVAFGAVLATCEESGMMPGLRCAVCDEILEEPCEIPPTGHEILPDGWVDEKAPTCTAEGELAHEVCRWCACALDSDGNRMTDISIPMTGHFLKRDSDGSAVEIDPELVYGLSEYPEFAPGCIGAPPTDTAEGRSSFTCDACGKTAFVTVIGHYFEMKYNDTEHWKECVAPGCGLKKETEEHQLADNKCTVCEYVKPASEGLEFTLSSDGTSYSVTGIGTCTDTDIIIPSTHEGLPVTAIGDDAFSYCTGLTSIEIPDSVTSIGDYAFSWCTGLTSIEIPDSVTSICNYAFYSCSVLASIEIPIGVTSIGNDAFAYCSGLVNITVESGNTVYHSDGNCLIETASGTLILGCKNSIIPTDGSVTSIGSYAFSGCTGLTSIEIPDSVTSIGDYAFSDCTGLTSIEIPDSVTSIGDRAFSYCTGLTSVEIPGSVTSIGNSAFSYCTGLTSVEIPDSVTSIGEDALSWCTGLTSIEIPASVTSIGEYAFSYCTGLVSITVESGNTVYHSDGNCLIETASGTLISGCKNSIIPTDGSITSIGDWAFSNCTGLTSIEISGSVTSIGEYAFSYCTGLTSVEIPGSVTSIGFSAFEGCTGLTSIEIPDSVTSICNYAFYGCTGLTSITIPNSVTSIGSWALGYCSNLSEIVFLGTEEQWNAISKGGNWDYDTGAYTVVFAACDSQGHDVTADWVLTEAPTYTKAGSMGGYCAVCRSDVVVTLPAFSDTEAEGYFYTYVKGESANCANPGIDEYIYSNGGFTKTFIRTVYGYHTLNGVLMNKDVYTILDGVNIMNDNSISCTETQDGYFSCDVCHQYVIVRVIGLCDFDSIEQDADLSVDATCFSEGVIVKICPLCCKMYEEILPQLEHLLSIPLIETDGDEMIATFYCERGCGYTQTYTVYYHEIVKNAPGCGVSGIAEYKYWFTECDYASTEPDYSYIVNYAPLGHIHRDEYGGVHEISEERIYTLDEIKDIFGEEFVGFEFNGGMTSGGFYNYDGMAYCSDCGMSIFLRVMGEHYWIAYEHMMPTCEEGGYSVFRCEVCGLTEITDVTDPVGHILDVSYVDFYPDPDNDGMYIGDVQLICSFCGSYSIAVSAYNVFYYVEPGNCQVEGREYYTFSYDIDGCEMYGEYVIMTYPSTEHLFEMWWDDAVHCSQCMNCGIIDIMEEHQFVDNMCSYCGYVKTIFPVFDGLAYALSSDGTSYSVTGIGTCTDTDIIIPSTYEGLPVTAIGSDAFSNCTGITSVEIPGSVTSIGDLAFSHCTGLTSIEIPYGVTSIGNFAFVYCTGLTSIEIPDSVTSIGDSAFYYCTGPTSVEIPASVTSIGDNPFRYCTKLESITVESGNTVYHSDGNCLIETVSGKLISGCKNSIIPTDGSITSIGDYAFSECTGLTSIEIPGSVTSIGYGAFAYCTGLTSIEIPDSVTSIGDCAFYYCTGLTSIEIPGSVTSIGNWALGYCSNLSEIVFLGTEEQWNAISKGSNWDYDTGAYTVVFIKPASEGLEFTLSSDGTSYYVSGIGTCTDTDIVIPSTHEGLPVTAIGDYAFYNLKAITNVEIPYGVTSIGNSAFYNCQGITSVEIPASVTSIGRYAFYNCQGITSVEIPASVTSIGDSAFVYCTGLTSVEIPGSVTSIGEYAFSGCTGLTSIEIPQGVTSIGECAFLGCSGLVSITVESGNTVYHSDGNCLIETASGTLISGCKNSIIPTDGSITSIGDWAFYKCTGLTSVEIPYGVTSIGFSAFEGCTGLTSIEIPGSVTSIGLDAFICCTGLTSITIPNSVTSIGSWALGYCSNLSEIVFLGTEEQWNAISKGSNWDYDTGAYTVVFIKPASEGLEFTLSSDGTSYSVTGIGTCTDTDIIIPSTHEGLPVTAIGEKAFYNLKTITSVEIPYGVTSIGDRAFYDCTGLTSIEIPDSVIIIGSYAFEYCNGLTSIEIPDSVTSISSYAFWSCIGLTSIEIPDSVTSMGVNAFGSCTGIASITVAFGNTVYHSDGNCLIETVSGKLISGCKNSIIPTDGSVTSIGSYAFRYCTGLTSIEIPDSVTHIGIYAFSLCTGLTSIEIPDSVTSIGESAFSYCTGLTSVEIPGSVTSIGEYAFSGCTGLTSVEIPNSVTRIGFEAFGSCTGIASITVARRNTVYHSDGNCLIITSNRRLILGCKNSIIPTDGSVKSIGDSAFEDCTGLTSIVIPGSVTSIGGYAFSGCAGLTSITIPNGVTSIGNDAFYKCTGLTSIEIPDSVTSIGSYAFRGCTSLTGVTFENTSGWFVTTSSNGTSGTSIDVTNSATNATNLKSKYYNYYWKRS